MFWDPSGLRTIIFVVDKDDDSNNYEYKVEEETVKRLGVRGQEAEIITFSTGDEFSDKWSKTNITSNDDVIIHTIGGPTGIGTGNTNDDNGIWIPDLERKEVNSITLLSCNTGFLDENNNAAKQFLDTMDVNFVVAPDGTLHNNLNNDEKNYNTVEAYPSTAYKKLLESYNKDYREPEGFVMYYKDKENGTLTNKSLGGGPYYPERVVQSANTTYNKVR